MAEFVYALCAVISVSCALLLYRAHRRRPAGILLWVGACFGLFALNNVMLFVDRVIIPQVDLSLVRGLLSMAAALVLIYGLVWENR